MRNGAGGARHLSVLPARGRLSRATLYVFSDHAPDDAQVLALFYAAQRLAVTLELRHRPFIAELLAMRFTPREADVLRAGLKGSADEQIAAWLGLSVDAIRYYFKKFKHRVPPVIGHLKPRDLARVLNHLDKL
jgi:DNA-binding CsgD family transcriptional regulator